MKRISIAIVGLNFGRHIVRQLGQGRPAELFRITALCDQDRAKVESTAHEVHARASTDLTDLLDDPYIQVIGLFTAPGGRAELIRRCIRVGKDVLTTKPLENDPDAALEVLREARQLGRVVHLNSPSPVLPPDLAQIQVWREEFQLGHPVACRADVWSSYREQPDGSWYDNPQACPAAPIFRLGIYLVNDLVRLFGPAERVQVLHSRLFTGCPTPDNAQLGILFGNGVVANVFASFCIDDGDSYSGLTLNFERGTIQRKVGTQCTGKRTELQLIMGRHGNREVVAEASMLGGSGGYQWEELARAVRGEMLPGPVPPEDMVAGLYILDAMRRAYLGQGVAQVSS